MADRILAVASAGGHWKQLSTLTEAFKGHDVVFASTAIDKDQLARCSRFHKLPDASRSDPPRALYLLFKTAWIIFRERPSIVISTGALPGLLCVLWARCLGARTIWIDSIANAYTLSFCGKMARVLSSVTLTQWPHLSDNTRVFYQGSIL